jgi:hypothetical protein
VEDEKMKEAIKGQDKLKVAVEKLETELFKDWPDRFIDMGGVGIRIGNHIQFTIKNFTVNSSPYGVRV